MLVQRDVFEWLGRNELRKVWGVGTLLGFACLFWGFLDPRFQDTEGFFSASVCLPLAVGVALIFSGIAITRGFVKFGFWFGLGLVGQAAGLQLIEAGHGVRYQHYRPLEPYFVEAHYGNLIFLALQAISVFWGILARWEVIKHWYRKNFRFWQLLAVGLIFFISSATVSREISVYLAELIFAAFLQVVNLGNIILVAWSFPVEKIGWLIEKFKRRIRESRSSRVRRFFCAKPIYLLAACWVSALAIFLNLVIYEQHPHLQDEVGFLYHARFLASGVLKLPAPPIPEAFEIYLMQFQGDSWFPTEPPGWPALLALGFLAGVPWLVNPLLAGINVVLTGLFFREIYGNGVARLGVLLLCVSPWHIFMAMNFMPHTFTLTCTLVALLSVALAMRTGKVRWPCIGGGAVGWISLIRPLDGVIVAVTIAIWILGIERGKLKVSAMVGLAFGTIIIGALIFPYNKFLTSDPFIFPIMAYTDEHFAPKANAYGFGPERGMGWAIDPNPGHSPVDGLINANLNIFSLNIELFGWSAGSLLMLGIFLVSGTMKKADYFMLTLICVVFIAYFFYYFSGGPDFGARYWYLMLIPLIGFTARGIKSLDKRVISWNKEVRCGGNFASIAVIFLCFFSLVNFFPWRSLDKYYHYLNMRPDILVLAKENNFERSLVLIRGKGFPDYASVAVYNAVRPDSNEPIYAWARDPITLKRLLKEYWNRPVWVIDGPSLTSAGYEVRYGPLSAREILNHEIINLLDL